MTLEINRNPENQDMQKPYISDRRLYLNADQTRVLEEGHPDARFVFAGKDSEISGEDAKRLGLTHDGSKIVLPDYDDGSDEISGTIAKPLPTDEADAARYVGADALRGIMFASGSAREKAKHAYLLTEDFEGEKPETTRGYTESQVQGVIDRVGTRTALDAFNQMRDINYAGVPGDINAENGEEAASLDDIKFASAAARKHAEDAGLTPADFKGKRRDSDKGFTAAKVDAIAEAKTSGSGGSDEGE